jgi:ribonuclease E
MASDSDTTPAVDTDSAPGTATTADRAPSGDDGATSTKPAKASKDSPSGGKKKAGDKKKKKAKASAGDPAATSAEGSGAKPGDGTAEGSDPAAAEKPKRRRSSRAAAPEAEVAEAAPGGPAFGVLFQAPEPTVVPRRSRSEPADAPAAAGSPTDGAQGEAGERSDDSEDREDREDGDGGSRRRRRGGRGRRGRGKGEDSTDSAETADSGGGKGKGPTSTKGSTDGATSGSGTQSDAESGEQDDDDDDRAASGDGESGESSSSRRRRRRRRSGSSGSDGDDPPGTVTKVREPRAERDEPTAVKGSTRLEAKKQRRREGREAGRRRTIITEAEFLARRESVERTMVVRGREGRTQIGVLEDGVLVEHYVSRETTASMAGNVYLGRVQNVLPSMEAAFVDIGKGRNAVLYAGEVNWDAAGLEVNQSKRIENALSSGDTVLVQVTKDPIGHKGARLTSQISLPGRYLVFVPEGQMTGISRKLPDTERARLKGILKAIVPDSAGVIVRTAAEGASEEELRADVERLSKQWERIRAKADKAMTKKSGSGGAPVLLHGEPDLTIRVIRDVFTEDFASLVVSGEKAWSEVSEYVEDVAPDLAARVTRWTDEQDVFAAHRIDEQLAKAMDRKVWLPSGGSLVIDRTEAMTVVDVNTGKFVGSGGNLEETVTKNNLEAAEEIVRQLRLRDIGGIIVIDFIDMVLESNRDLVVRRLLECLGRDRTKHQVAEVTSLGLVQMTRKRVGSGLIEVFSEPCEHCGGRGIIVHTEPVERGGQGDRSGSSRSGRGRRGGSGGGDGNGASSTEQRTPSGPTAAQIAAAAHAAALRHTEQPDVAAEVAAEVAEVAGDAPSTGGDDTAATEPTASHEQEPTSPADEQPAPETPAPRARRKRGRVVAPAGPPPGADPTVVGETATE